MLESRTSVNQSSKQNLNKGSYSDEGSYRDVVKGHGPPSDITLEDGLRERSISHSKRTSLKDNKRKDSLSPVSLGVDSKAVVGNSVRSDSHRSAPSLKPSLAAKIEHAPTSTEKTVKKQAQSTSKKTMEKAQARLMFGDISQSRPSFWDSLRR